MLLINQLFVKSCATVAEVLCGLTRVMPRILPMSSYRWNCISIADTVWNYS